MTNDIRHNNLPLFVLNNNNEQNNEERSEGAEAEEDETYVLARTTKEKFYLPIFLNTSKVVERTIKHSNVSYICPEEQWRRKINKYLERADVFSFIGNMVSATTSSNDTKQILMEMCNLFVKTTHQLYIRKVLTNEQYSDIMYYNQSIEFELNKLDFISKIRNNKIVIQPIIKCSTVEPMKGILKLINDILQPLIEDKLFHQKTFSTANEAIEALQRYSNENLLQFNRKLFVTIQVHDLRTTLPHHLIIRALEYFLQYHKYDRQENRRIMTTTTIIELVELFLKNQFCLYDENKLYRQIRGSSVDSPLITTLMDIFLFSWQYPLLQRLGPVRSRVFGRCHNQFFFIWNDSKDKLVNLLDKRNFTFCHQPQDIGMTVTIDYQIHYLDADISHIQPRRLQTGVYHHSNFAPYALPYVSTMKTPSTSSSDILLLLRAALIRAILYCSNVYQFENELLNIELSFLLNDVSFYLIHKTIENLFIEFHIMKRDMFMDELTYELLRSHVRSDYQSKSEYHLQQRRQQQQQQRLFY